MRSYTEARVLLPELVGLTDAFGFSDWELDSVVSPVSTRPHSQSIDAPTALQDRFDVLGVEAFLIRRFADVELLIGL
jgi:hypothetical protein